MKILFVKDKNLFNFRQETEKINSRTGLNWSRLLTYSAHLPLHQSCLWETIFHQRVLQFWLLLEKCFYLFQLQICLMFFNQNLVWCSHSRIKFPFRDTYKTWNSQSVQTWKRHQEAQFSTHNYKSSKNRINLVCPICSLKFTMIKISLFSPQAVCPRAIYFLLSEV